MNIPAPLYGAAPSSDGQAHQSQAASVSVADQQAFAAATLRLRTALQTAADGNSAHDVGKARTELRNIAVKLRDAGFWRSDKQGLRATVSLLWEADRFVNDQALMRPDAERPE